MGLCTRNFESANGENSLIHGPYCVYVLSLITWEEYGFSGKEG